jgi:RecJ-like exonuclease
MSNERLNPYYNKKHNKKQTATTASNIVTRLNAAHTAMNADIPTVATATDRNANNEMNASIKYEANHNEDVLNKSMILNATSSTNTYYMHNISRLQ